jgi:DNA-binding NarL/FixJ family response regulator
MDNCLVDIVAREEISTSQGGNIAMNKTVESPVRIWLVDNEPDLRELFASYLTSQTGLQCTRQFSSAQVALRTLAAERGPDVLLLDVHLNGECGLDAIRPIKAVSPSTHVLMLTTFNDHHSATKAFQEGASGFLLKSYEPQHIARLVRNVCDNPQTPGLFPDLRQIRTARAQPPAPARTALNRPTCSRGPGFLRTLLAAFTL